MRTRVTRIYLSHSMTFLCENKKYRNISHFKMLSYTFYQTLSCACSFDLGKMIIQYLISTLNVLAYAKYLYNLINSNAYERDVNKT